MGHPVSLTRTKNFLVQTILVRKNGPKNKWVKRSLVKTKVLLTKIKAPMALKNLGHKTNLFQKSVWFNIYLGQKNFVLKQICCKKLGPQNIGSKKFGKNGTTNS